MAHRLVTQVVIIGSRIIGRSFAAAYKQAQASSQGLLGAGMTLEEACKILNVKPPKGGQANAEEGGSFYLQSKVVRAKERLDRELGPIREKLEQDAEVKEGFKPKIYKD
ncbi:unnamed protein product [Parascedosporium putredinis]|uniref:Mitochondrial import inner membrane translocase subunit TIM16 n=1 Tax=Parascedosporium putredinis TaxID=1442378 RepID=A0A9P1H104_9PEZI|nr:unnamed protein product [Parascedosporium putredinis]CAI7992280.1 unnamed protein product [Parascedosporium putredinis]